MLRIVKLALLVVVHRLYDNTHHMLRLLNNHVAHDARLHSQMVCSDATRSGPVEVCNLHESCTRHLLLSVILKPFEGLDAMSGPIKELSDPNVIPS